MALLVTCEHGGNRVPEPYRQWFHGHDSLLDSHRGFDPGALFMARVLARCLHAPLLSSTVSRLLVDLNRSIGHRQLHMDTIRALPAITRRKIIEEFYQPYRTEAERLIVEGIRQRGRVVHISCHSFTDNLNGVARNNDVGLLYDPAREQEASFCARWKTLLHEADPGLRIRRNFPYEGRNDGLTTTMRKLFPANVYLGVELELNQQAALRPSGHWPGLRRSIITTLHGALNSSSL